MVDDELFRVKGEVAGVASADVRVSKEVARIVGSWFPGSAAKRAAKNVIAAGIVQKLATGEVLDAAELEYAEAVLGDNEAKFARRRAVEARAVRALESGAVHALLPPAGGHAEGEASTEGPQEPDEDWLSRFWADAELVSDEVVQEVYGRILASEAAAPGTCSKRTLAVLRGLDRAAAETFARVLRIQVSRFIPRNDALLKAAGLDYGAILELGDVGLVESSAVLTNRIQSNPAGFTWGTRGILLRNAERAELPAFPLTRAGEDLARIADVECDIAHFDYITAWFRAARPRCEIHWALLPSKGWTGDIRTLEWFQVTGDSGKTE